MRYSFPAGIRVLLLLCSVFHISAAPAQQVDAYLDRDEIYQGETVLLTVEVTGQVVDDSPDVGLLTGDFQILDSQRNSQVEIVDGRHITKDQWIFELEPNNSGELPIPAMNIGPALRTPALTLNVLPVAGAGQPQDDDIFIEVSAQPSDPYVQSQVRYSERLFYAVALRDGSLNRIDPPDDAVIMERIGEELTYVDQRNGRNYRVIERNFAIFPQQSGSITLPAVVFRGRVSPQNATTSPSDRFITRGRQVRIESERLTLQVQPRPAGFSGTHWLPSAELSLLETWSEEPPQFRVGEPVTRTLVLQARGLDATQLPELTLPQIAEANIYPDQPLSETRHDGSWLVGRREQRLAIVPTQAGDITLPEIRLIWWDTENRREQVALIPARTIRVAPAQTTVEPAPASVIEADDPQPVPEQRQTSASPAGRPGPGESDFWRWASIALLVLWLLTLLGWQRERRHHSDQPDHSAPPVRAVDIKALRRTLRRACRRNDPHAAARALLSWAEAFRPQYPPTNLAELAQLVEHADEPLRALDRALYAPAAGDWQGDRLWRAVKNGLKLKALPAPLRARERAQEQVLLPPLYPQRI